MRSSSGTPTPCTCARCCPTCTSRTPPARPSTPPCGTLSEATSRRPARTHRPALASGTRARGRRFRRGRLPLPTRPAPASAPEQRFLLAAGPTARRGAPNGHTDALARTPSAAWPARHARPRHAHRPHCVGLSGPLPTAGWTARTSAWRRFRLGRPPLPMRPAPASAPGQRNLLAAGPSAHRGAPIGHADALAHTPPAAWPAGRALPRHAHRPHCVGLSGPLPTASWTARTPPRPPRAPHPHGTASASAARRYPCARPRPRPPAGCAARPPVSGTQGQAPGNST